MIKKVDESNFNETINRDEITTVVKFEADWCMPCKEITPAVESLNQEWKDRKVEFVAFDIESDTSITNQYGIFGVPTFIAFQNGQPVSEVRSRVNIGNIKSSFEKFLV
jgi:thioredoxin-like negative regulator of GroEL